MNTVLDLIELFFREARQIVAGERESFSMMPSELLSIAAQPAARSDFDRRLAGLNDPKLRKVIKDFIEDAADEMADLAANENRKVDLLDRVGLAVAASTTAAGVGTTVVAVAKGAFAGGAAGPLGMLAGGLMGLILVGIGRNKLKRNADERISWGRKLRRLIGKD